MPKESNLRQRCTKLINQRGGWARSVPQSMHSAGMADVIGCYRRYSLVLETKLPGKEHTLTQLQAETLRKAKAAGAIARMVTTVNQVRAILDQIDRKLDGD